MSVVTNFAPMKLNQGIGTEIRNISPDSTWCQVKNHISDLPHT